MRVLPTPALALAASQHAVLARWQLRRWCSLDAIDGHVARENLERLTRGVYRLPGTDRPEQAAVAAALRARPAVLTGPFVLAHLRIDHFEPGAPFEVLTRPGRSLRNVDFPHRADPYPDRTTLPLGEVRLAAPVDALLESALSRPAVRDRDLRVAKDQLGWRGLLTAEAVARRIDERGPDDPAAVAFLEAMDGADLRSESEGERWLAPIFRRLDPMPQPQVWVTPRRRLDWYLAPLRLGWEYLGPVDHAAAGDRRADDARDRELAAAGIRLLYITKADVREPAALLASVMGALAVRADELGAPVPTLRPA